MRKKILRIITTLLTALNVLLMVSGQNPNILAADGAPDEEDLRAINSGIEYPHIDEYFPEYHYAVVRAPGGHSVYGYGSADHQGSSFTVPNNDRSCRAKRILLCDYTVSGERPVD